MIIIRMPKVLLILAVSLLCSCFPALANDNNSYTVSYDKQALIINGQRRIIFSGAIHYPRSTPQMWPDLIQKGKDFGLDCIETYIFWDQHEPHRRQYDFSGNLDFISFFKQIHKAGLYAFMRIGPYSCAEWNYGGFPVWLHNLKGIALRTDNVIYKNEMQIFTTKVVEMCKKEKLFASQGGPIILSQIENEYGNIMGPYGKPGVSYMNWAAQMAVSLNTGVPWIMCQQSNAPDIVINTCNGFYCDQFVPKNPANPKLWTENWLGWFKAWGGKDPHRPAEDEAFAVARFFQNNGIFNNYYMFHGGTNFGRTSGGPYMTTSYDYDSPIDEYGNLNQPKYGHLKQLHAAIKVGEKIITDSNITSTDLGNSVNLTMYISKDTGERFCYLSNTHASADATVNLDRDGKYFVPAWSISILQNCNKEIFNTAKVNTQTSIMVKKSSTNAALEWSWAAEPMNDTLSGKGTFEAKQLLEQKETTVDASDYLWYMTTVTINDSNWNSATLSVNTSGHVLHAFVNGNLIGSQWATGGKYNFLFRKSVTLSSGTNIISLLSATVGLKHYGSFFDLQPTGINGGPVTLIGSGNANMDLSSNTWSYKVGLNGWINQFYNGSQSAKDSQWSANQLPSSKPFTWYKTVFSTPSGIDPVVVDLQGMGKGMAWVNGRSLGRYWPAYLAPKDGCPSTCDYRNTYHTGHCMDNCGNPTQRWYHIPRSFLTTSTNVLVLFEEIGGNPSQVSIQTVTIGTVCANAYEGNALELSCQGGQVMSNISFASFGNPTGKCWSFQKGSCDSANALSVVQKACVGKDSCTLDVSQATLGTSSCKATNRLAVQATC